MMPLCWTNSLFQVATVYASQINKQLKYIILNNDKAQLHTS